MDVLRVRSTTALTGLPARPPGDGELQPIAAAP